MLAFRSKLGTSSEAVSEKSDALLRALQKSNFVDVWTVLQLLHQNTHPGVQEYLCNRIPELGEAAIERYLLQFIYLAVSRPGQHLERILLKLCAESFRVAIKTQWLLVALCQDHPRSKALESFREQAYKGALEGKWEVPIRSAKLDPLSPNASQQLTSPLCSPVQSYMAAHLATVGHIPREPAPWQQPARIPDPAYIEQGVATRPPASMVMSPPGTARGACLTTAMQKEDSRVVATGDGEGILRWLVSSATKESALIPDPDSAAVPGTRGDEHQLQTRTAGAVGARPVSLPLESDVEALAAPIKTCAVASPPRDPDGAAAAVAAAALLATEERILALKRELGEGEGVSALLERARQRPVAAVEDDPAPFPMEDERPMSPLSQLRCDTFGATLDFVDALCYASSSLTNYPAAGEERQNALRAGLEHINGEIDRANRRPVAIWFPMGRKGDRVLRIAAREAVLLNSREKAPFMLFVEVLEGQNECGDDLDTAYTLSGVTASAADPKGQPLSVSDLIGVDGGGGLSSSMMALSPGTKLEFGRRETYGIALTGIGAQHQQQFMHSTPSAATTLKAAEARKHRDSPETKSQAGGTATGQSTMSSPSGLAADPAASRGSPSPGVTPPLNRPQSASDMLISPTPTRAASLTHALLLEEQAAAVATARQSAAATPPTPTSGTLGEAALEATTPCTAIDRVLSRISAGSAASVPSLPPAATEIVIPTRSASSNNIAAAAAAALAASASGGGLADSILASARSSEGGAAAVTAAGAAAAAAQGGAQVSGGGQPQTPRSTSSLSGLPPRPPSSSSSSAWLHQQQLPVGGISPINAAKEVSSGGASQEGGGLLAASNLLRRVFGDRAEAGAEGQAGPGAVSTGRSLVGQANGVQTIASAAGVPGVPPYLLAAAAAEPSLKPPVPPAGRPPVLAAGPGRYTLGAPQPSGAHTAEGLFSTQSSGKSQQEVMTLLSHISASLRGELPMVRVKIVPVGPGDAVGGGSGGGGNVCSGGGPTPSLISALGSRAKAALLSQQPQQQQQQQQPAVLPEDSSEGGPSKTMALLSRLGLCRKPAAEEDAEELGPGQAAATAVAQSGTAASAGAATVGFGSGGGGGASQVTIPVTSSGVASTRPPPPVSGGLSGGKARLVRLVLTVATQRVNLDIKSPHRKSRRTPSHEAIEMMAGKYNVQNLPPPIECGPPLGPGSDGSAVFMERVVEPASEEEEGPADAASAAAHRASASMTSGEGPAKESEAPGVGGLQAAAAPQPDTAPIAWTSPPMAVAEGAAAAAAWPEPMARQQLAGGLHSLQPTGSTPETAQAPDAKSVDAGGSGSLGTSSSGLAASLQSSITRILNRSAAGQQQSQVVAPPTAAVSQPATDRGTGEAAWVDGAVKAPAPLPRAGSPVHSEAAGGPGPVIGPASSLTASLQSSLTRILNRGSEAAQPTGSGGSGSSSTILRPRGVSPVRSSSGSQTYQATTAASAEAPAADRVQPAQPQQRTGSGGALPDGGPCPSAPSGAGLAASLHSSLNRILNRSAQGQQQPAADGQASSLSLSGGGANPLGGPSPRGSSPVRPNSSAGSSGGAQAAAGGPSVADAAPPTGHSSSSGASRLSKLLGRSQPTEAPQPATSTLQQALVNDIQQQKQQQPVRPFPGNQAEQAAAEPAVAAAAGARPPPPRSLPYNFPRVTDGRFERESLEERRRREAHAVYGERWAAKVKRIQRESPHGRRQGWALRCVIVKSGDDCRQELLALQLVRTFGDIFAEAGLPLWVRYYEVLVTSNKTALIEMVPNTLSIHTIKSRSPPSTSLSDHFFAKFGRSGTPECTVAQRRFTESLAAYSLICYLLQIKDRHNGNILIDDEGRVVHIDYGFLLSNSPGGVNFESAPFKLTRELLEVMDSNSDGRPSEMFDYFKVLMIQGFIAVRSCSDRIMLLVKIMAKSGFPCFKGGERALKALEKRFMLSLAEVQCVEHMLQLIGESLDAWRTRQYDYYQRVLNGIL